MKHLIPFLLLLTASFASKAQMLQGDWKGEYAVSGSFNNRGSRIGIDLKFVLNKDNSYSVYSYTNLGYQDSAVCQVYYERYGIDSVYLEEVADITDRKRSTGETNNFFQSMWLKIIVKEKHIMLQGVWGNAGSGLPEGEIMFWRPRKKE